MKYSRWNWSLFGLFIPFFCSKKCQLKEISYQIKGVIFLLVCSSLILVWRWKVLKLGEGRVVSPCPPRCRRVARITTRPHHILAELRSQGHLTLYYPPLSRDCHTLTTSLIKHFQNIFAIFGVFHELKVSRLYVFWAQKDSDINLCKDLIWQCLQKTRQAQIFLVKVSPKYFRFIRVWQSIKPAKQLEGW